MATEDDIEIQDLGAQAVDSTLFSAKEESSQPGLFEERPQKSAEKPSSSPQQAEPAPFAAPTSDAEAAAFMDASSAEIPAIDLTQQAENGTLDPNDGTPSAASAGLFEEKNGAKGTARDNEPAKEAKRAEEPSAAVDATPEAPAFIMADAETTAALHETYTELMRDQGAELEQTQRDLGAIAERFTAIPVNEEGRFAGEDTEGVRTELSGIRAEIERAISDINRQLAAAGEAVPGMRDHLMALQGIQSEIDGLMTQLANGQVTPEYAKSAMAQLQISAGSAVERASSESHTTLSEFKAEVYEEQFQKIQKARDDYRLSLAKETAYFENAMSRINNGLLGEDFSRLPQTVREKAVANAAAITAINREHAENAMIAGSFTPEQTAHIQEVIESKIYQIRQLQESGDLNESQSLIIDRIIASQGGIELINPEAYNLIQRVAEGSADSEFVDNFIERSYAQQTNTIIGLETFSPNVFIQIQREAQRLGISLEEYIKTYPLNVNDLDIADIEERRQNGDELSDADRVRLARNEAYGTFAVLKTTEQMTQFGLELAYGRDFLEQIQEMSAEEIQQRLAETELSPEFIEFVSLSPEEQIEKLIAEGRLDENDRSYALAMARIGAAETNHMTDEERASHFITGSMELGGILKDASRREGESTDEYSNRMNELAVALAKNPTFNPHNLSITGIKELMQRSMETSNNTISSEEFNRAYIQIREEIIAREHEDEASRHEYRHSIDAAMTLTNIRYSDHKRRVEVNEQGFMTDEQFDQARADFFMQRLTSLGVDNATAISITNQKLGTNIVLDLTSGNYIDPVAQQSIRPNLMGNQTRIGISTVETIGNTIQPTGQVGMSAIQTTVQTGGSILNISTGEPTVRAPANSNDPEAVANKKIADMVMAGVDPALARAAVEAEKAASMLAGNGVTGEEPAQTAQSPAAPAASVEEQAAEVAAEGVSGGTEANEEEEKTASATPNEAEKDKGASRTA